MVSISHLEMHELEELVESIIHMSVSTTEWMHQPNKKSEVKKVDDHAQRRLRPILSLDQLMEVRPKP